MSLYNVVQGVPNKVVTNNTVKYIYTISILFVVAPESITQIYTCLHTRVIIFIILAFTLNYIF